MKQPSYYGILPADVRYDETLTDKDKLLYVELTVLTIWKGVCWAHNDYLGKALSVNPASIPRMLRRLQKARHISVVYEDDNHAKRRIRLGFEPNSDEGGSTEGLRGFNPSVEGGSTPGLRGFNPSVEGGSTEGLNPPVDGEPELPGPEARNGQGKKEEVKKEDTKEEEGEGGVPALKTWYDRLAANSLRELLKLESDYDLYVVATSVKKQIEARGRHYVATQWGDTLRLLHEQDGHPVKRIEDALDWLIQPDNPWMLNGWILSLATLRSDTRDGDKTKFEAIYLQSQDEKKNEQPASETLSGRRERLRKELEAAKCS